LTYGWAGEVVINLILLFEKDFINGNKSVRIRGRRYRHITEVQRIAVGDELTVGLGNGPLGKARITHRSDDALEMDVHWEGDPPPAVDGIFILALPRPPVLKRVLAAVTSMGIKRIYLINTQRVEKSFWNSRALKEEAIRQQLILGLEQARDTVLPQVVLKPYFKKFVQDELPALCQGRRALAAHPGGDQPCPRSVDQPFVLAIGPEGGFIPYEISQLQLAGFSIIDAGRRILRVETAVAFLLGRLLNP